MKTLILSLAILTAQTGSAFTAAPAGAESMEKISRKLSKGLKEGSRLAVLEFPYTDGKASEGPAVVQERLTTALAANKKISLIERALLAKVMGELKLQASGSIDGDTAKKLGKLLGADAIVTGTLNDLKEGRAEINARVVDAGTARILTAASAVMEKTWKDGGAVVTTPVDFGKKPLVQLAILLDTSGSMDGLINQARSQLWKIVNELVGAEKSGSSPVIEVALYEYGNSGLPAEKGYMRQVLPFTRDMDKVAQELFALTTNGGDEYAGMAIRSAVTDLGWSKKDDVYKAVFIAGNEPFTQGPVDFREAAGLAKGRGIFVNTIFCGPRQQGIATRWQEGALLAGGDFSNIDQSVTRTYVEAPQDARIAQLGASLGNTAVVRGVRGSARRAEQESLETKMAASGGKSALAERAAFKAMAPAAQSAAADADWDMVSALESGSLKRSEIKKEELPEELRKMSDKELDKTLDARLEERRKIKEEITRLQAERRRYIEEQEKQAAAGPDTLDKAVLQTVRSQASKKGYKFSGQ